MNAEGTVPDLAPADFSAARTQELAKVLRHLGVLSLHTAEVDLASHASRHACSVGENGEVTVGLPLALDIAFPGGSSILTPLATASVEQTRMHKISAKRCLLAWRAGAGIACIVDVQFRHPRHEVSEVQTELIRFVSSASVQAVAAATPDEPFIPSWAQFDPQPPRPRFFGVILGLMLAAAVGTAWLAGVTAPAVRDAEVAQQLQITRLRDMAERTLAHKLSAALATADYGEVQGALSDFSSLGYFEAAVVTNDAHRIVATSGVVDAQRIGDGVTPEFARRARVLALKLGSQTQGQLLFVATASPGAGDSRATAIAVGAGLAAGASLLSAGLLALRRHPAARPKAEDGLASDLAVDPDAERPA